MPTTIPLAFSIPFPRTTAAALSALLIHPLTHPPPVQATPPPPATPPAITSRPAAPIDEEHALADEIWQLIDRYYIDTTFNSHDWQAARAELQSAPLSNRKATYRAARRMVKQLNDRYTRILTPAEMNALRKFDVSGVGLLLTTDAQGELVVAATPATDSEAGRAGIGRGDVLLSVDGVDVGSVGAFRVSQMMQGGEGTEMELEFRRGGLVKLKRKYGEGGVEGRVIDKRDGKMGYVKLKEFRASAREEVERAVEKVVREGAEWVVLDLRGNGGGVFEGALEIAGVFEGEGVPVARVLGRGGEEVFESRVVDGVFGVDVAVLMDGGSASSSEVLAGGLRESCKAVLVGERSFGKGVIQGVFGLSDGGGVVVTVAEYRTPGGGVIEGVGLMPDLQRGGRGVRVGREEVREVLERCRVGRGEEGVTEVVT